MDEIKNLAVATVLTPPSPATTGLSLVLQSGHGARLPVAPFQITVWPNGELPDPSNAEILTCSVKATDTLTIVRAQEDSTARAIIAGDRVSSGITLKFITDFSNEGVPRFPWMNAYTTGRYYNGPCSDAGIADPGFSNGRAFTNIMPVYQTRAWDRIGFWLNGNYGAGTVIRLGIFSMASPMRPGKVLYDAGTIAVDAGAPIWKELTISPSLTLKPGYYNLVGAFQGGGSVGTGAMRRIQQAVWGTTGKSAGDSGIGDANHGWFTATGAFTDDPTMALGDLNTFLMKLRAA